MPSHRQRDLCRYCENDLPWLRDRCEICGLSRSLEHHSFSRAIAQNISGTSNRNISGTGNTNPPPSTFRSTPTCASCTRAPSLSPITKVVAPLAYTACASALVQQQKNRNGAVAARVLAELLGDAVLNDYNNKPAETMPNLLVPVPLHWRREWHRGHNQSTLLASHLSNRLQLPMGLGIVRRTRVTPSQQQLNIAARTANMRNAFSADTGRQHAELNNARIAIIDDVTTTGATARALARELQRAGAGEVHLWSPTRAILSSN